MKRLAFSRCRCLLLLATAFPSAGRADVATDGSFGKAGALPGPGFAIPAILGKKVGGNLFHSFSEFSLDPTQSATFTGPADVANILSRVTGGNISSIDGALKSEIAGANFFLLNPKGVLFGPNASVDVSGSFAVATGDRITLEDGAHFKARASDPSDALLTSAAPAAFGFLGKGAGPITVDGSQLPRPPDPKTGLPTIGGKWTLAGGDIRMKNDAVLNASGVVIRGGRLTMKSSKISAFTGQPTDRVDVKIRGAVALRETSSIETTAFAGGDIRLSADSVSISGGGSGISATSSGTAAASIRLDVAGELNIQTGSLIRTEAGEAGTGGSVFIHAGKVAIINTGAPETGIAADTISDARAGDVRLEIAGSLSISGGGKISSDTFGAGAGGNIGIAAQSLRISGEGLPFFTAISTETQATIGGGPGGNIDLKIRGPIDLTGGGQITASSFGDGDGGSIDIAAAQMRIDGLGAEFATGVTAKTQNQTFGGRGGNVRLRIFGPLDIVAGGTIGAGTVGPGVGGSVAIGADALLLSGERSSITASTASKFGGGPGGNISIEAGELHARDGAEISASTAGSGTGGSIGIVARKITLDRATISADTTSKDRVADPRIVSDLSITLTIDQAIDENLGVALRHPDGTTVFLAFGVGGQGRNFVNTTFADNARFSIADPKNATAPFTGRFIPLQPLAAFDRRPFNGEWTLAFFDENPSLTDPTVLKTWTLSTGGVSFSSGAINVALPGPEGTPNNVSMLTVSVSPLGLVTIAPGRGGDIRISADSVDLRNNGRISARTLNSGTGGSIDLGANDLRLSSGGAISAATAGFGAGGSVRVTADSIAIAPGGSTAPTLISAESTSKGAGGSGGDISIDAGSLRIDGAPDFSTGISALSRGAGDSGSVRLQLGTLELDSSAFIGSSNTGDGNAGSVFVRADGSIFMRGGSVVSVSADEANAGSIDIASGTRIDLRRSSITASAGLNGGSIAVAAPDFIHLIDSSITAIAGTTPSPVGGQGGNISIDPEFMVLDHSVISANAAIGRGGNIFLQADNFLSSETSITATGTTAGTVEIVAPELDLSAALVILPGALVDASTQLREQCARRLGLDFSSFLVIGRGGVSLAPDDPLAEYGPARKRNTAR